MYGTSLGKTLVGIVSMLTLLGLAMATPLRGPGYDANDGLTMAANDEVVVAVTSARYTNSRGSRRSFWKHVETVERSLAQQPGFIAFSKRREILGNEAWTMTVWTDEASLDAFVRRTPHIAAMRDAGTLLETAGFVRFRVDASALPVRWEDALARLESDGRRTIYRENR